MQVRWFDSEPGDSISVGFPVEGEFDMHNPGVQVTDEISLGVFDLNAGQNVFTAEVVGANPKAKPGYMFGLDYLILEAAP